MTSEDLTSWFDNEKQTPVRNGVYQVIRKAYPDYKFFSYWDGTKWGHAEYTADEAYRFRDRPSYSVNPACLWRGLCGKT